MRKRPTAVLVVTLAVVATAGVPLAAGALAPPQQDATSSTPAQVETPDNQTDTPDNQTATPETEENVTVGETPEDNLTEEETPEDNVTIGETPEDNVTEEATPEDNVTEAETPEDNVTEAETPEANVTEEPTLAERLTAAGLAFGNVTDSNLSVTFENQSTTGATVTVQNVTLPEGGFVAIHDERLLDGVVVDSVIGSSEYLEPGTTENVTISLFEVPGATYNDTSLLDGETLLAMPHLDTNGNETYDFVAAGGLEDGPYLVDGLPFVDPANVTIALPGEPVTGEATPEENVTVGETPEDNVTEEATPEDNVTVGETPTDNVTGEATPEDTATDGETPTETVTGEETPTESGTPGATATETPFGEEETETGT